MVIFILHARWSVPVLLSYLYKRSERKNVYGSLFMLVALGRGILEAILFSSFLFFSSSSIKVYVLEKSEQHSACQIGVFDSSSSYRGVIFPTLQY